MNSFKKFQEILFREEEAASIGLFRILLGIVLFAQTLWFIKTDFIGENVIEPVLHFKFYHFQFLNALPPTLMKLMLFLMLVSTFLIIIGKFFKYASAFFGLSFTYLWLIDKSYFNNHYYFISLIIFLLIFTNADAWGSYSKKVKPKTLIPSWQIFVLKFQVFLIFFIAGINKINTYWIMDFQPIKHIVETKATVNNYEWLATDFWFAFFSWGGLIFDLTIGFLIWSKRTRKFAIVFYVIFNLVNFWLFYDIGEIGFFPFLLLACLVIFFDSKKIEQKLSWLNKKQKAPEVSTESPPHSKQKLIFNCIIIYVVIQLVLPFRHILYNNNVDWSGHGQRFAWRMKIMYKDPDMHFYLSEKGSDQKAEINVGNFLNQKQYTNLIYYPDFIPTVARHIKSEGLKRGFKNPVVTADFKIGFMGKEKVLLVNPNLDLSTIEWKPFENSDWINQLK